MDYREHRYDAVDHHHTVIGPASHRGPSLGRRRNECLHQTQQHDWDLAIAVAQSSSHTGRGRGSTRSTGNIGRSSSWCSHVSSWSRSRREERFGGWPERFSEVAVELVRRSAAAILIT
jgi:hypothetical protein